MKIIRFNFIWNKNKIEIIKCDNGKFVMIKPKESQRTLVVG